MLGTQLSGVGWTQRWDTVTLDCPANLMIVNASTPAWPSLVRKVWRSPCKTNSRGNRTTFFPSVICWQIFPMLVIEARYEYGRVRTHSCAMLAAHQWGTPSCVVFTVRTLRRLRSLRTKPAPRETPPREASGPDYTGSEEGKA